jgi:O-antigen ligase
MSSYLTVALVLLAAVTIYQQRKLQIHLPASLKWLILYYVWIAAGVFTVSDFSAMLSDLRIKLPFVLFPLIFSLIKVDLKKMQYAFIAGNLIAVMVCFSNALAYWFFQDTTAYFFYINFSYFMHPSYFSMYLLLAVIFAWDELINKNTFFVKWLMINVLIVFVGAILLLSSRTAVVITPLLIGFLIIKSVLKRKQVVLSVIIAVLMTGGSWYLIQQNKISNRLSVSNLLNLKQNIRYRVWQSSAKVFLQNPILGTTSGDVKAQLQQQFEKDNIPQAVKRHYNTHNQFLQILVANGIVGMILMLMHWIFFLKEQITRKKLNAVVFLLLTFVFMTTESVLERQAGAMFYAFFIAIFAHNIYIDIDNERNEKNPV